MCASPGSDLPRLDNTSAFDSIEASGREAATFGRVGGITVRAEAKPDEIEQILRSRMIGSGIEPGREPVHSLDLMQQEQGQLTARNRTRNLVVEVPANIVEQFHFGR